MLFFSEEKQAIGKINMVYTHRFAEAMLWGISKAASRPDAEKCLFDSRGMPSWCSRAIKESVRGQSERPAHLKWNQAAVLYPLRSKACLPSSVLSSNARILPSHIALVFT